MSSWTSSFSILRTWKHFAGFGPESSDDEVGKFLEAQESDDASESSDGDSTHSSMPSFVTLDIEVAVEVVREGPVGPVIGPEELIQMRSESYEIEEDFKRPSAVQVSVQVPVQSRTD